MNGSDIFVLALLVALVLVWVVAIPRMHKANKSWEEYHRRQIAMLRAWSEGRDWPPKEDKDG